MQSTSFAVITRSPGRRCVNRAIFSLMSAGRNRSVRHSRTSGWMPIDAQLLDRVLGRLGLQLLRRGDVGHQGEVDEHAVLAADLLGELPDGLEKRQALDVADGAADLHDNDVGVALSVGDASLISSVMWGITCTVLPR